MTQVVASSGWTGLPDDTFADLGEAERQGNVTFEASTGWLKRERLIMITIAILAGIIGAWLILSRPLPWLPLSWLEITAAATTFLWAAAFARFLSRRIAEARLTAPLHFSRNHLGIGETAQKVAFAAIDRVRPAPIANPIEIFFQLYPGHLWRRSPLDTVRLEMTDGRGPIDLDLNVLRGDPARIARILEARIAFAKKSAS
jgi:hypothetical protein